MSCYKLPEGCCNEIESMLAKFWSGSKDGERKIHWTSWERLSKAKKKGGMGFRGISDFNKALLGKHYWRLLNGENTLIGKVFKCRYHPRGPFMEAKMGFLPSYAWRSMLSARDALKKCTRWLLGNGEKIKIWHDNWFLSQTGFKIISPVRILSSEALVSELIDAQSRQWNREIIFSCFSHYEAQQIINIPISNRLPEDKLIWHWKRWRILCEIGLPSNRRGEEATFGWPI